MCAEFYKLFKSNLFKIMLILNILITLGYVGLFCSVSLNNAVDLDFVQDLYYVLFRVTLAPGPVPSILCVSFVALYLTNEFQSGTIELFLTSGMKRVGFIYVKFASCILGALVLYIIHTLIGVLLFGIVVGWDDSLSIIGLYPVFRSICLSLISFSASMAVSFFYSILWRNVAGALITVLVAPQVLNWTIGNIPQVKWLLNFYPNNMLTNIAIQVDTTHGLFLIMTSIVLIIVMFFASYLIFLKCDVKG